jgi:hypothetical protein
VNIKTPVGWKSRMEGESLESRRFPVEAIHVYYSPARERERKRLFHSLTWVFRGNERKGKSIETCPFASQVGQTPVSGSRACYFVFFRESADQFGRRLYNFVLLLLTYTDSLFSLKN